MVKLYGKPKSDNLNHKSKKNKKSFPRYKL